MKTKEGFIRRFDAITTAIKKIDKICGYCYTQVTDVRQEINSLLRRVLQLFENFQAG